jgi:hypothetical protein
LWPTVGVWAFDRLLRLVRIISCNLHVTLKRRKLLRPRSAISYEPGSNVIRVEATLPQARLKPRAGQHYFLYQPFAWTGWENHPFTLGYWEAADSASAKQEQGQPGPDETADAATRMPAEEIRLVFFIRPCNGWTRRLRDLCLESADACISPCVLVEGPYGHQEPMWMYDDILMIAGGTGISTMLPHLLEHIARKPLLPGTPDRAEPRTRTRTRRITLLWVDKSDRFMLDLASRELAPALRREDVRVRLYATATSLRAVPRDGGPPPASALDSSGGDSGDEKEEAAGKEAGRETRTRAAAAVEWGRPDIAAAVDGLARAAGRSGDRAAVFVCGPPAMADAARDATYDAMKAHCRTLEYLEESFGW